MNTSQRIWNPSAMLLNKVSNDTNTIIRYVNPESTLEQTIVRDKYWQVGAFWGEPRPGHPEGKVIYHIHEVLQNVDKATQHKKMRQQLRLITIIHDTFKHLEEQTRPRTDWSKHHAIYALKFAKKYIHDQAVLDVIELHDDAYYAWCAACAGYEEKSNQLLNRLRTRLKDNLQLFYLFFKCDTQTGDKYQSPVTWFEEIMQGEIEVCNF
ncbi:MULTISPECIES: hypothetical protein [unclassified Aureispira]|uniref:hypothetical protein n=1 Tax=unclassified Aureispira TaxID=2649989 RepID=UPI0009DF0337|nr:MULTISPECIES: hypothetical protein [unclassified Aureispira]WMX14997.1 hypothetical protein QP953_01275 [Aureispira sp. CCB-E]